MSIGVDCPKCGKSLRVSESQVGKSGKCPKCQTAFEVPGATGRAAVASPASGPRVLQPADLQFRGQIKLPPVGVMRKLGALAVLGVLLLMHLFYVAVLVALVGCMAWLAVSSTGRSLSPAVFWVAQGGCAVLLVCLVKRLIEPQRRGAASYPVDLAKEPLLVQLLQQLAEQMQARQPTRVYVNCDTRVAVAKGGQELTLGLPLVACLSAQELAGTLAHDLALVRRGSAAGVTALIRGINGWLWRSVYGKSRFDQWLSVVAQRQHFHVSKLLLPLAAMKLVPQAVLFVPMFIANTIGAAVIRASERDADRTAARLIGSKSILGLLEREELIEFTWEGVLAELEFLHREQQLPEKLPDHLALRMLDMTPELRAVLGETVTKAEDRPFDTRASRPERVEWLAGEPASGVFTSAEPAKRLLVQYDALAKTMSRDLYASRFGGQLLRTAIQSGK